MSEDYSLTYPGIMLHTIGVTELNHKLLYPINYINQWHHVFTVSCQCGWESKTLGDSNRRVNYRDPVAVAEQEHALHVKCAEIEAILHRAFKASNHPLPPEHDWSLHFDNSIENYYLVRCSCGWQTSMNQAMKVRQVQKHYMQDIVKLRKYIRSHTFTQPN